MDKRQVIIAYRRGFITIEECAQIIGVDNKQMTRLVNDPLFVVDEYKLRSNKQPVNS